MKWSNDLVEQLKKLWNEGKTANEIANELGKTLGETISRNAVIGKAHRLQLKSRPSPIKTKTKITKPTKPSKVKGLSEEAKPLPSNILMFSEHVCQWPMGDPSDSDFKFCGKKAINGKPYCLEHAKKAYQNFKYTEEDSKVASSAVKAAS